MPVVVLIVDSMMSSVKAKEFWFTLTSDTLTWYKDDEEKEVKYQLPLDGVRVVEAEDTGMFKRKFTFCLVHPMKKAIFKVRRRAESHQLCSVPAQDHKSLDLTATSQDEKESWQAALLRAGVYPMNQVVEDVRNGR